MAAYSQAKYLVASRQPLTKDTNSIASNYSDSHSNTDKSKSTQFSILSYSRKCSTC